MAELCPQDQETVYYCDDQGRPCVDIWAKDLDILDGDNPRCWQYTTAERHGQSVHFAELVSDNQLEVKGQHSPVHNLLPNTWYRVLVILNLKNNAHGFQHCPVTFEFTDQHGNRNQSTLTLKKGSMRVLVGKFVSVPGRGSQDVKFRMSNFDDQDKSGLQVRCVRINPVDHCMNTT